MSPELSEDSLVFSTRLSLHYLSDPPPISEDFSGTVRIVERAGVYYVPTLAFVLPVGVIGTYIVSTLSSAQTRPWYTSGPLVFIALLFGLSALAALTAGILYLTYRRTITIQPNSELISVETRIGTRRRTSAFRFKEIALRIHGIELRQLNRSDNWKGWGLVLWLDSENPVLLRATKKESDVETYLNTLPAILRSLYVGRGISLVAKR